MSGPRITVQDLPRSRGIRVVDHQSPCGEQRDGPVRGADGAGVCLHELVELGQRMAERELARLDPGPQLRGDLLVRPTVIGITMSWPTDHQLNRYQDLGT